MTTRETYHRVRAPEDPTQIVSVRRILRDWSHANDEPLSEDDLDRIISIAARHAVVRY